ncbi:MAG: hypothetical protein OHK0039_36780 [Bacteroidia bacterium]
MLVEYYFPESLSAARLDRYLAGGWFRSGPSLFRTRLLCLDGGVFSVVNVRVPLQQYTYSRSLRRNFKRNTALFRYEIGPAYVDEQQEALYRAHKHRFKGFVFDTLEEYLFSGMPRLIFDTWEVRVYDGDKLIATSYFDRGQQAVASLLGLFDHDYRQHSLGLFTMLVELEAAQSMGMRYYYPGYVLQGHGGFDYKLRLGSIEYYNWSGRWRPWDKLHEQPSVTQLLEMRMAAAEEALRETGVAFIRCLYPYFSLGYLSFTRENYLRSAMYLRCYPTPAGGSYGQLLLEYLQEDECYQLCWVEQEVNPQLDDQAYSETEYRSDTYTVDFLIYRDVILRHPSPQVIARRAAALAQHIIR